MVRLIVCMTVYQHRSDDVREGGSGSGGREGRLRKGTSEEGMDGAKERRQGGSERGEEGAME